MGLALGGIAAPLPRIAYGWVGDKTGAGAQTQDLTVGGFSDNLEIKTVIQTNGGGGSVTLTVVCGGSTYDLYTEAAMGGTANRILTAFVKNGNQITIAETSGAAATTHAFALSDITAIRATASAVGNSHIYAISAIQLDNP